MPSLAEIAFGPNITGAIGQGAQVRQSLNQVRAQNRQNRALQSLDQLVSQPLPSGREAQATAAQNVGSAGGFEAFSQARQLFGEMNAEQGERELQEGRAIATGLAGVTDQASYENAVGGLQARGIDVSRLPAQFDPATRDFLVNVVREVEDVAAMTPEQFRQQMQLRQAGASTTNVNVDTGGNQLPPPPAGFVYARNPDNTVASSPVTLPSGQQVLQPQVVPIGGGPAAQEAAAAEEAAEARQQRAEQTLSTVNTSANAIRRIMDEATLPTAGFAGSFLSNIGGTAARNVAAELETIKANASFERLQQMRDQSPTGGALGQVSNTEIGLLSNAIGSLEQSQSEPEFRRNLERVENAFAVLAAGSPDERDRLVAEHEQAQRFAEMSLDQIVTIDPATLNDAERAALERRLTELGF